MLMRSSEKVPAKAGGNNARTSAAIAEPRADGKRPRYQWTIMVYLAGDNNLSDEMIWALKEVFRVGTPHNVAVTFLFDPVAERRPTRFFRVPEVVDSVDVDGIFPILHDETFGESNSGNPATLVRFIKRSARDAPADRYMLILSGHGSGVIGGFLTDESEPRKRSLELTDLRNVFQKLRKQKQFADRAGRPIIDVLGMDTCLMSMVETCSEIRGDVGFLVGSEGFDPNTGWPYYRLLEDMRKRTSDGQILDSPTLVRQLVRQYVLYYADFPDANISVDISACDVAESVVNDLEARLASFVKFYLEAGTDDDAVIHDVVVLAHWRAQSYKLEQYADLRDFFVLLEKECRKWGRREDLLRCAGHCTEIRKAIDRAIVEADSAGPEFQYSNGLSVYFPWSPRMFDAKYLKHTFADNARWAEFLIRHLAATQRPARDRNESGRVARATADLGLVMDGTDARLAVVPARRAQMPRKDRRSATRPATNRLTAADKRFNMPSDRFNMPSDRIAHEIGVMFQTLPTSMKNMPTAAEPVIPFSPADEKALRGAKRKWTRVERE
jgi:hypothetical protein